MPSEDQSAVRTQRIRSRRRHLATSDFGKRGALLAEAHWPATIKVGIGMGRIGRSSVVVSYALFLEGKCIGVCDMTLVLVGDGGPTPFPEGNREVVRKLLLGCGA